MSDETNEATEKLPLTAKQRLDERDRVLDKFEADAGLPAPHPPGTEEELEGYLNMGRTEMATMSAEACAEVATRLSQYSFYLQRLMNVQVGRRDYAEAELRKHFSVAAMDFDFVPFDTKLDLAIADDSFGTALRNIATYARQRIDRLEYLSKCVSSLADKFTDMRRSKTVYENS